MPAITDLTWNQLNTALKQRVGTTQNIVTVDAYENEITLNMSLLLSGIPRDSNSNEPVGVVRAMALLFDACRDAQQTVSASQPAGEKLNAFIAPTTAAPVGTLVQVTRTMNSRADLTSVTKVIGPNA